MKPAIAHAAQTLLRSAPRDEALNPRAAGQVRPSHRNWRAGGMRGRKVVAREQDGGGEEASRAPPTAIRSMRWRMKLAQPIRRRRGRANHTALDNLLSPQAPDRVFGFAYSSRLYPKAQRHFYSRCRSYTATTSPNDRRQKTRGVARVGLDITDGAGGSPAPTLHDSPHRRGNQGGSAGLSGNCSRDRRKIEVLDKHDVHASPPQVLEGWGGALSPRRSSQLNRSPTPNPPPSGGGFNRIFKAVRLPHESEGSNAKNAAKRPIRGFP